MPKNTLATSPNEGKESESPPNDLQKTSESHTKHYGNPQLKMRGTRRIFLIENGL
ncbi:hypothetical protein QJS83_04345 [Bdellovibrio sp. 22V]|uniref:hypothetical protein n=1 Tax=Bdellovibrio sp. 22V TaxID=3044166 RepID=UPI002543F382|nr:hypothetical protein [Bdellovibrio sp. 22V]WII73101.1 hypothetical protein QJS83_04345 [Bdellovibrio sp. 22V]